MIEGLEMVQVALPSERKEDPKIAQGAKDLSQIYRTELAANRLSQAKPNSPGKQPHQGLGSSHPHQIPVPTELFPGSDFLGHCRETSQASDTRYWKTSPQTQAEFNNCSANCSFL